MRQTQRNHNNKSKRSIKKRDTKKKQIKTKTKTKKVKMLIVSKKMSDNEIKTKEGEFFPATFFDHIIKNDTDVYYLENKKKILLCSFRKKVIPDKLSNVGYQSLYKYASRWHTNRGAAAGIIDSMKMPPHIDRLTMKDKFRAYYYSKKDGKFHKDHVSNLSQSNIIGYYDMPDRNIKNGPKCRETKFIRDFPVQWQSVQPLLKTIGDLFMKLIPDKYNKQYKQASETPLFQIQGTPFSTATINYNWQTALHKDKGDFVEGFGNLIVMEKGKWSGCYLGFPQYGVCVDVRQGDFLAMDVHQWHCNTDLKLESKDASRVSMVCYLRHKMIRCKTI